MQKLGCTRTAKGICKAVRLSKAAFMEASTAWAPASCCSGRCRSLPQKEVPKQNKQQRCPSCKKQEQAPAKPVSYGVSCDIRAGR